MSLCQFTIETILSGCVRDVTFIIATGINMGKYVVNQDTHVVTFCGHDILPPALEQLITPAMITVACPHVDNRLSFDQTSWIFTLTP